MSTLQMAMVWPLWLPASQKAVLVSLADQANDEGLCWPSVATISLRTCLSERTVQLGLRALELAGLLRVGLRSRGGRTQNQYWLTVREWLDRQPKVVAPGPDGPGLACPNTPQQLHRTPAAAAP